MIIDIKIIIMAVDGNMNLITGNIANNTGEKVTDEKASINILGAEYTDVRLKAKQQQFAERFIGNGFNASEAAKFAGYSDKNARVSGNYLLQNPNIQEYIRVRKTQLLNEIGVNTYRILKELASIAFADYKRLYNENGTLKNMFEVDSDVAASIMTIEVFEAWDTDGNKIGETKKVRFNDKLKALEMLMKYMNMFEKSEQNSAPTVNVVQVTLDLK